MLRREVSGILYNLFLGVGWAMSLILCEMCSYAPAEAVRQAPDAANREQTSIIVYLHPVATEVEIRVNDLPVFTTGSVFGSWYYQFNMTSFLDTKPRTVEIRTGLGNKEQAYCEVEVRKISGNPATTTVLAKKTIRGADLETWTSIPITAVTIDIDLPGNSMRPLWMEHNDAMLKPAVRDTYTELLKEIFTAMQKCDVEPLMALIDSALTNQAEMEGAPPDLFKQAMRGKLKRWCIPNISVAKTQEAFYDATYSNRMAPLNFEKLHYFCIKDPGRADKKGNLYVAEEPIQFYTKKNHLFAARVFLSCTNDGSKKWYVSRFLFDRTE